ncbi:MAG: hypothetical protein JW717_08165 [Marinilabiliaceae bacterium]|nr:hypothetical protein [Marinilabiliaceae bacterium]
MVTIKSSKSFVSWLLRVSLLIIVYQRFADTLLYFDILSSSFYVSLAFVLVVFFIFLGGILSNNAYTIIGGIALIILTLISLSIVSFMFAEILRQFVLIALGAYFIVYGNNKG